MTKTYLGDDHLAQILQGSMTVDQAKDLLQGIAAAPLDRAEPKAWLRLFPAGLRGLDEQLSVLLERLRRPKALPAIAERLAAVRAAMAQLKVDVFYIPRGDEFLGEYVSARAERLAYATGFTGSAGMALVMQDRAAFFTDGRYTLQAQQQVDQEFFDLCSLSENQDPLPQVSPLAWLEKYLRPGMRVGLHMWLHRAQEVDRIAAVTDRAQAHLVFLNENPVDMAWGEDQPPAPLSPVVPHGLNYAGKTSAQKRSDIAALLQDKSCAALAVTLPEDIAWLLNIRAYDVPHTPISLCYGLLHHDGRFDLFIDTRKLLRETIDWLGADVRVQSMGYFIDALEDLGRAGARVWVDPNLTPVAVREILKSAGGEIFAADDPIQLPKAVKNAQEVDGAIAAHERDGVALTRFLAILAKPDNVEKLDELKAEELLTGLRATGENFRGLSFDTIAGAGANGAIVHYRATEKSNKPLTAGPIFLLDSGAQYLDGTTDVTRTIAVGAVDAEMKDRFTRVLKAHIAVARAEFTPGTTGRAIDALARAPLWEKGLDYAHGTGHGVGSYLSVHEGPVGISPRAADIALMPGMILSNEPGYYKSGAYGIRIENLVLVEQRAGGMLGFKTLTLAPIDVQLIEVDLLSAEERAWVDDYHAKVREALSPFLNGEEKDFLIHATRPLAEV